MCFLFFLLINIRLNFRSRKFAILLKQQHFPKLKIGCKFIHFLQRKNSGKELFELSVLLG